MSMVLWYIRFCQHDHDGSTVKDDMTNLKLNQAIALTKGAKSRATSALTAAYHTAQKPAIFAGISRTYRPRDEEGETLPPESTIVQRTVPDLLSEVRGPLTRLFDVVVTVDNGNTVAFGDVIVNGRTIATHVPVPTLLFLEKQLVDLRTFVAQLPTLDASERWSLDDAAGTHVYRNEASETTRGKKIPRVLVKAEATDKHPAQVDVWQEDVVVGFWSTTKFSGAIPITRRSELVSRIEALIDAVKQARERANETEVPDVRIGDKIFDYLLTE